MASRDVEEWLSLMSVDSADVIAAEIIRVLNSPTLDDVTGTPVANPAANLINPTRLPAGPFLGGAWPLDPP